MNETQANIAAAAERRRRHISANGDVTASPYFGSMEARLRLDSDAALLADAYLSLTPEVKELPDGEGWWWEWEKEFGGPGLGWKMREVLFLKYRTQQFQVRYPGAMVGCIPGRWVKANPPTLQEKPDGK